MTDRMIMFVVSGFGFGLSPVAPGTCGTIFGVLIVGSIAQLGDHGLQGFFLGIIFVTLYILNDEFTEWAQDFWKEDDPEHFVLDEIAGYILTITVARALGATEGLYLYVLTFLFFRVFDVWKPWPASVIDKKFPQGGDEIFLDDCVAGIYAGLLTALIL